MNRDPRKRAARWINAVLVVILVIMASVFAHAAGWL